MSLPSRITKITQNFDIFSDVPWQHGFPEGSNANAIGETGIPSTRQFLSFHLRRALLSLAHAVLRQYSNRTTDPGNRLISRMLIRLLEAIEESHATVLDEGSLEDLSQMDLAKGPSHIAVSLQLASSDTPPAEGEPADPVDRLLEEVANLVSWVAVTPSVERLTVYEKTDALHKIDRNKLESTLRDRAKASGYPTKELDISFVDEHHEIDLDKLAVVFATDVLKGQSCLAKFGILHPNSVGDHLLGCEKLPDLFVSFDSQSNGIPLAALNNALIYDGHHKGTGKPELQEYLRAVKTFQAES